MAFFLKKKTSNPIYFVVGNKRWGTFFLRGLQVQRALRKSGTNAHIVTTKTLPHIKNSIVIFVKSISDAKINSAQKNGNKIIWDILDGFSNEQLHCVKEHTLDGLIYSTVASLQHLTQVRRYEDALLYHHIDPRIRHRADRTKQHRHFSCCYIGNTPQKTNNVAYLDSIPSIDIIETDTRHAERGGWIQRTPFYTCHYAVRTDPFQCNTKPLAKVSVAAACNANMVVNRSNAAVELLGDDYPFLCGETAHDAQEMVAHARDSFGSATWKRGLERMQLLRERLSLENSAREYQDFLKKV